MAYGSRINMDHRRKSKPSSGHMELVSRQYNEAIARSSKALLKAQLTTGQHALDKERFLKTAMQYGWGLDIPRRLLP